jgi:ring-1,2-phenylacetyl-CoA epoxidase subunit PaaD
MTTNDAKQMTISKDQILTYLREVKDPEVPVIDVVELGVIRHVELEGNQVRIDLTPTYSGCPAMKVIEQEIVFTLNAKGIENIVLKTVLSPPWTTDWMSEETRQKLKKYGITPPGKVGTDDLNPLHRQSKEVSCPFCDSTDTRLTSQFGSTACKALYYCHNCQQPFEHFKCL